MRIIWIIITCLFTGVIWYHSSMPAEESHELSEWAVQLINFLGPYVEDIFPSGDVEHSVRKLAHFLEFAVLSYCVTHSFAINRISNRTSSGYILFYCLLVAVVDEYIQFFSPGRSCMVNDVLLDFSGSLCVFLFYRICQWK